MARALGRAVYSSASVCAVHRLLPKSLAWSMKANLVVRNQKMKLTEAAIGKILRIWRVRIYHHRALYLRRSSMGRGTEARE